LDFGCGAGDFITAADSAYEMWGHDLSEYAVEKARQNNPHLRERFSSGSPDKLQYPPAFFDGILMWDVIEHLWDPGAVCGQLLKYLKPGGSLFISTPDIGTITAKATGKYWAFMTPPEHLGFFSKQSITYLLEKKMACRIQAHRSLGKWANTGFILYKLKRIFPRLVPGFLPRFFQSKYTRNLGLYVPTGDIQYVAARKLPQGGAPGLI
jgi:SAM-dependent methyltransferase